MHILRRVFSLAIIMTMTNCAASVPDCGPDPPKSFPISDLVGPKAYALFPSEKLYLDQVKKNTSPCDFKTLRYAWAKDGTYEHFIIFHGGGGGGALVYGTGGMVFDDRTGHLNVVPGEGITWQTETNCANDLKHSGRLRRRAAKSLNSVSAFLDRR